MTSTTTNVGELVGLARSFERHLRASNRSPRTITTYLEAVGQLCSFLVERGMPTTAVGVHREHVESFLIALHEAGRAPAAVVETHEQRCGTVSNEIAGHETFPSVSAAQRIVANNIRRAGRRTTLPP